MQDRPELGRRARGIQHGHGLIASNISYLKGLFANDNFNAGTLKAPPDSNLRVLTRDVILVSTHLRVGGQKLVGGGEIPERNNFSLRVLQRQSDGQWLIVSEMYNDANQESTYEGS
jgi:hypothetical protein